jgi:lambda family phage tail tape measure protein
VTRLPTSSTCGSGTPGSFSSWRPRTGPAPSPPIRRNSRSAGSTAERTKALTEDAFRGLGDALTDVFTTGKADWRSLEKTIVSGITRIIIEQQAIKPIAQYLQGAGGGGDILGSLFSSALGLFTGGGAGMPDSVPTRGGRARGGRVEAGGLYPVNELASHGPGEILTSGGRQYLMARESGYVQPMQAGGGGVQQVNHFHISGPVDRRTQQQIATAAGRGAQQAMARNG